VTPGRGAPVPDPGREAAARRSLLVLAALLLLTEAAVRLAAPRLWRDPALTEAVSAPLLRDRIRALGGSGPCVVLLGDSVCYGSALREHGVADWRHRTPAQYLRERLGARGLALHSFAADGLEAMDQEALARAASALGPRAWVVELNPRILSEASGSWPGCMDRPYLQAWLPDGSGAPPRDWVARAGDGIRTAWATYRTMELASALAWQPSLRARMESWVQGIFPAEAEDEDARDALLDLKLRPYYQAPARRPGHLGWESLARLAAWLRDGGRPALVFLTPQNGERIADLLDPAAYAANRRGLAELFRGGGIVYRDWADRRPKGRFLDHCHLDAEGNQDLAAWIDEELGHAR